VAELLKRRANQRKRKRQKYSTTALDVAKPRARGHTLPQQYRYCTGVRTLLLCVYSVGLVAVPLRNWKQLYDQRGWSSTLFATILTAT